jgi:hypothetical protein
MGKSMKNRRIRAVTIVEVIIALPLIFLLGILAIEFVEKYGLIVFPIGVAVYFVISRLVDKYFWEQSAQLEQSLERKLSFRAKKTGCAQKDG